MNDATNTLLELKQHIEQLEGIDTTELRCLADRVRELFDQQEMETKRLARSQAEALVHSAEIIGRLEETETQLKQEIELCRQLEEHQKLLTKEAKQAEALAQIIADAPFPVFIHRLTDLRVISANKGAIDSLGYSREELYKLSPLDFDVGLDAQEIEKLLAPLLNGEATSAAFETAHRHKSGDVTPVQVNVHLEMYEGEPVFFCFVAELTAIKQLERQLAQAEKLESLGAMSAGLAHEINSPMQYISANVEFAGKTIDNLFDLIDQYRDLDTSDASRPSEECRDSTNLTPTEYDYDSMREDLRDAIDESRDGVERVVTIIQDMRSFSHPGVQERQATDLHECLESTITISQNRWKYVAQVKRDFDTTLPSVPIFASELNQVLLNLVNNATDAIQERHGEGGEGLITVKTQQTNSGAVVEVADNGNGIPEPVQRKIFDQFFTTKEVGKGTGQGLAICRDIVVNMHGGSITFDSEVGVGTTFRITLPLEAEESPSQEQACSRQVASPALLNEN